MVSVVMRVDGVLRVSGDDFFVNDVGGVGVDVCYLRVDDTAGTVLI